MKSSLIFAFLISSTLIKAQDEAGFNNVTTHTEDITLKPGNEQFDVNNTDSHTSTKELEDEQIDRASTEKVNNNQDEEKPVKRSTETHVPKEDNEGRTGYDIETKAVANNPPSKSKTTGEESNTNDKNSSDMSVTPIVNQSTTAVDRLKINSDLSTEEHSKAGDIDEKHDNGELNLQSKNDRDPADGIERSANDDEGFSLDSLGVKEDTSDGLEDIHITTESFVNSDGIFPLKATRKMFGNLDLLETKGRSDDNTFLEADKARPPDDPQVTTNTFGVLNQFGSRWNYPSDLVVSHLQPILSPSSMRSQTVTATPQPFHSINKENDLARFMRRPSNFRASDSTSVEPKHIEYYNTLEGNSNAYPYVPIKKQNHHLGSLYHEASSTLEKTTGFPKMQQYADNFYKPYDANHNSKMYNPYDYRDKNFQYYQPLIVMK